MKINSLKFASLLFIAAFVLMFVTASPALAQGPACDPADPACVTESVPAQPDPGGVLLIGAQVLAVTAFFKTRFSLKGNYALALFVGVASFFYYEKYLFDLLPWLKEFIVFLQWLFSIGGTYDFGVDWGPKVAGKLAVKK